MDVSTFIEHVAARLSGEAKGEVIDRGDFFSVIQIGPMGEAASGPVELPRRARITFTGAEMFILNLDDRFTYPDSAVEDWEQVELIDFMVAFAVAYVTGKGTLSVKKGVIGRPYEQLDIVVQGKSYRVKSGPLMPSWREISDERS